MHDAHIFDLCIHLCVCTYCLCFRGYWFQDESDVNYFRSKLKKFCPASEMDFLRHTYKDILVRYNFDEDEDKREGNDGANKTWNENEVKGTFMLPHQSAPPPSSDSSVGGREVTKYYNSSHTRVSMQIPTSVNSTAVSVSVKDSTNKRRNNKTAVSPLRGKGGGAKGEDGWKRGGAGRGHRGGDRAVGGGRRLAQTNTSVIGSSALHGSVSNNSSLKMVIYQVSVRLIINSCFNTPFE